MARYTCGKCLEPFYGLGDFKEHIEAKHDYPHVSAAVQDCESVDELGEFENPDDAV